MTNQQSADCFHLTVAPLKEAVAAGGDAVIDALIRVSAPDAPEDAPVRPPLNLAFVIDRSGSMSGEPLAEAKRCVRMMIDHLTKDDHAALVDFGSDVHVAMAAQAVVDRAAVERALSAIHCNGSTALHAGWLKGAEQIAARAGVGGISRVLLLSDGCANEGLTDRDAISLQADELRRAGVSTSTYGLGHGFDETLMTAMAVSGGGSAYYGKMAQDLMGSFMEEFELLSALCARELRLRVASAEGVIAEILNDHPQDGAAWRLPDLAFGAEAWAMLRLRVPAERMAELDGAPLVKLSASARDLNGIPIPIDDVVLSLPTCSPENYATLTENELVARRLREVEVLREQQEAAKAAERGDWDRAEAAVFRMKDLADVDEYLSASVGVACELVAARSSAALSKQAHYKATRRMVGLSAKAESAAFSVESERSLPSYLRRKLDEGVGERETEDAARRDDEPSRDASGLEKLPDVL